MRQIILDTETTGLDPRQGHRIIEVAGVEVVNRRLTHRHFHHYINPDRDIDEGAQAVHGISREFLADKPRFGDIVDNFLDFIDGAELVIHNAPFDVGFLNSELELLGKSPVTDFCASVTDTLKMARDNYPGKRNSLDALCERLEIDNSHRNLHGALLDAELLAEVYLMMTRGQDGLAMVFEETAQSLAAGSDAARLGRLTRITASDADLLAHQKILEQIQKESGGKCVWLTQSAQQ
ncbi:MAG: DNA polymerase III subunit epsilon [Rhodocyclaceae bacterium]|jgi:DNA polymerase-3 subunit epsilon|nr:DNA polymerase III subunit epsilon [Rhodocyclaceae bacterium]